MTQNQIAFYNAKMNAQNTARNIEETIRHNVASETETNRANTESERIRDRQNLISENTLAENIRANQAREAETYRANVAKETETHRANTTAEKERERANRAAEAETAKWHRNTEYENFRSARARETLSYLTHGENVRHAKEMERQGTVSLANQAQSIKDSYRLGYANAILGLRKQILAEDQFDVDVNQANFNNSLNVAKLQLEGVKNKIMASKSFTDSASTLFKLVTKGK